jgi:inhibitor of the pro-sigma K processing machinery
MKTALMVLGVLLLLVLLRRPLLGVGRLVGRSALWLGVLWVFRGVMPALGISLGINLFNGAVLGLLGVPGLALLMMVQWVAG